MFVSSTHAIQSPAALFACRLRRTLVAGLLALALLPSAHAQDAKAALSAAVQLGAIEGEGAAPFRLKATYETFDYMGRPLGSGTLEETFLKPGLRRRTLIEGGTVDRFSPDDEVATVADQMPASGYIDHLLADAMLSPGPDVKLIESGTAKEKQRKVGDISLRCISLSSPALRSTPNQSAERVYCLDDKIAMLRMAGLPYGMAAIYNKVVKFGGHTLAEQVTIQQFGKIRGKLQVVSLTPAPDLKESDFQKEPHTDPPVMKSVAGGKTKVAGGVIAGNILTKVAPVYPEEAKMRHMSGTVLLRALIGKEGTIENLEVLSAPDDSLAESAMQAVSQWRYKPFLLNGLPTEVDTTITVNYAFGR